MAVFLTLTQKSLSLVIDAIDARIDSEIARYQITPPSEDAAGDYGNDLHLLRMERHKLAALRDKEHGTAAEYQCWHDPRDSSLSLLRRQDVAAWRANTQLSDNAILLYSFVAHTGEEAMAIHTLRQGWSPYLPNGDAAPCPTCGTAYYPKGYGDCWRCGHIG